MDDQRTIGFGVAGNMTGHLEQAGEASDFVDVATAEASAPKGMFPFFVPGHPGVLGTDPLSSDELHLPAEAADVQIEPEVALALNLTWAGEHLQGVQVTGFAAYNDASIRRTAEKISQKKNWGPCTKGLASPWQPLDELSPGGLLDRYRLTCFLLRDDTLHAYGEDSEVRGYSYFHDRLLDWIVDRLRHQTDHGPLESLSAHLETAGRPTRAIVSIGATRYTALGESTFLQPGDHAIVVVYDGEQYSAAEVRERLLASEDEGPGLSVLRQVVR
jgi:hypothetical protein